MHTISLRLCILSSPAHNEVLYNTVSCCCWFIRRLLVGRICVKRLDLRISFNALAAHLLRVGQCHSRLVFLTRLASGADCACVKCAATAASTAVLINRVGTPLNGAIYWAIQAGFSGGKYGAKIASQGCEQYPSLHDSTTQTCCPARRSLAG